MITVPRLPELRQSPLKYLPVRPMAMEPRKSTTRMWAMSPLPMVYTPLTLVEPDYPSSPPPKPWDPETEVSKFSTTLFWHPPVLADSASIVKSDVNGTATATWSQTGGSDDPSFISSVVNSSGAVSVTNASGAPAPGEEVKITYDYNSVGIMGALASNPNAWLEVSVDGSPLLPRQRLVAVPLPM